MIMFNRSAPPTLLVLSMLAAAAAFPACNPSPDTCPKGQTAWKCLVQGTPLHMPYIPLPVCAGNMQDAIAQANGDATLQLKLQNQTITGTTCNDTGSPKTP